MGSEEEIKHLFYRTKENVSCKSRKKWWKFTFTSCKTIKMKEFESYLRKHARVPIYLVLSLPFSEARNNSTATENQFRVLIKTIGTFDCLHCQGSIAVKTSPTMRQVALPPSDPKLDLTNCNQFNCANWKGFRKPSPPLGSVIEIDSCGKRFHNEKWLFHFPATLRHKRHELNQSLQAEIENKKLEISNFSHFQIFSPRNATKAFFQVDINFRRFWCLRRVFTSQIKVHCCLIRLMNK